MCFEPMQAERFDLAAKPLNHSATLSDQRSVNGKLNQNNEKLKQDASLLIEYFFCSKQRKLIKSNHCSIKDRLDFCVFEM